MILSSFNGIIYYSKPSIKNAFVCVQKLKTNNYISFLSVLLIVFKGI